MRLWFLVFKSAYAATKWGKMYHFHPGFEVIKLLCSGEHEIYPAHKC